MKVLVADDHPIMRLGVRQLILGAWPEAEVDEVATLAAACDVVATQPFDAVVLDMVMPDASGTESIVSLRKVAPDVPVLVLSFNDESAYAARALRMGVQGYLPKDRASEELVTALSRVMAGKRYVTASMAELLVDALGGKSPEGHLHEGLSSQEYRVMLFVAAGVSPAAMAERMQLSVKTIGTYRARMLSKTGLKSNAEVARYCQKHGLG